MKNYICIDGKKAELTPEQLKALGLEREMNPFERKVGQEYYYIDNRGYIARDSEVNSEWDGNKWKAANYCTNKEMMQQRAYAETLNRLLWRYSMEHGGREIDWSNGSENKYYVYYNSKLGKWYANYITFCYEVCTPYFHTKEIAENAIKEIIEPFMAEHPDFKF